MTTGFAMADKAIRDLRLILYTTDQANDEAGVWDIINDCITNVHLAAAKERERQATEGRRLKVAKIFSTDTMHSNKSHATLERHLAEYASPRKLQSGTDIAKALRAAVADINELWEKARRQRLHVSFITTYTPGQDATLMASIRPEL